MKRTLLITLACSVLLVAATLAGTSLADDNAERGDAASDRGGVLHGCHHVHAVIVDAQTHDGCTSTLFCAAGLSYGNLGLTGTTYYTMDGFAKAPPSAGAGFGTSSGILVYTTPFGTLTVRETGTGNMKADASSGIGAEFEQVLSGTGRFEGASGVLYLASSAGDGQFVAEISGELCGS